MATELGTAYITVMPSMKGFTSKLTSELGGSASTGGKAFGEGFGTAFQVAAGALIAKAAESIMSAAADTFMRGFEGFMNFEQLSGGVEKIFDQANVGQIMADAQNAYRDLNMSANEYLDTINNVGATFAQTMGDQRGYDVARTGMKAISDYASGTGKDLGLLNEKYQLITRSASSYQSIADQFAGLLPQTSGDFLAQAQAAGYLSGEYEKLTEVPVAEYQEAVTNMLQDGVANMGLAGNTLRESTETISGSLAMLSGSWDNFLTGLFDENADIGLLGENLMDSIGSVLENVVPRIAVAAGRVFEGLPGAISTVLSRLPSTLEPTLKAVFGEGLGGKMTEALQGAIDFLPGFVDGIGAAFEGLMGFVEPLAPIIAAVAAAFAALQACGAVVGIISAIAGAIAAVGTAVSTIGTIMGMVQSLQGFGAVLSTLAGGPVALVVAAIAALVAGFVALFNTNEQFRSVVLSVWDAISSAVGSAVEVVMSHIQELQPIAEQVFSAIGQVVSTVVDTIQKVWAKVAPYVQRALGTVAGIVSGIVSSIMAVWQQLSPFFDTLFSAIGTIIEGYWNYVKGVFEVVGGLIVGVVTGDFSMLSDGISDILSGLQGIIEGIMYAISSVFAMVMTAIKTVVTGAWNQIKTLTTTVWNAIRSVITSVVNAIRSVVTSVFNAVKSVVTSVWNGIRSVTSSVWNAIRSTVSSVANGIRSAITGAFNGVAGTLSGIWNGIKNAITGPLETAKGIVRSAISTISNIICNARLSLPHIKVPHFNINGGEVPWGIGGKGSPPSVSISWYARGGLIDGATLIGVGEAGRELVVPTENERYMEPFAKATARNMGMGEVVAAIERFERDLGPIIREYAPEMATRDMNRMIRRAVA